MQHQGLTPRMEGGDDPWLRTQILGVAQQGAQCVPHRLKQQRAHDRHIGQPQGVEIMGQGEDHVIMVTGQEPRLLENQPALGLEVRTLRTRPVPTGVGPDARHVAVETGLDMAPEGRGPALHDGARGFADVGGQGMGTFVLGIAQAEDILQGQKPHAVLPRVGLERRTPFFIRDCADHPRAARLVQRWS
jgi:hypothetical protein